MKTRTSEFIQEIQNFYGQTTTLRIEAFCWSLESDLMSAMYALEKIAAFDQTSLWEDDRDDAASAMLNMASETLESIKR